MTYTQKKYEKLVFITGFPRSGTTLLQRLLTGGENSNFFPESNAISHIIRAYSATKKMNESRISAYFGNKDKITEFYLKVIESLLEILLRDQDKINALILKDPLMVDVALEAKHLFPDCYLLVTVRDPFDVVSSRMEVNKRMNRFADISKIIKKTKKEFFHIKDIADSRCDKIILVKYEQFCRNPAEMIENLAKTIGYKPKFDQNTTPCEYSPFHTNLTGQPISTKSIGRYKKILSREEIEQLQDSINHIRSEVMRL